MHALIYGTGKWAQLIGSKLDFPKYFIGSNPEVANFTRKDKIPKELKNGIVFIASETKEHFNDYKLAIKQKPGIVFVEKGFGTELDYSNAKKFSSSVPTFVMNQYRYSKVFETLKENIKEIKKCVYDWKVNSNVSEWGYHIASIDNYIRDKNNMFIVTEQTPYKIDHVSSFKIELAEERNLSIKLATFGKEIDISLGKMNMISFSGKQGIEYFEFYDEEDCLGKQIKGILNQDIRLERI
jgi:hypothetical protein